MFVKELQDLLLRLLHDYFSRQELLQDLMLVIQLKNGCSLSIAENFGLNIYYSTKFTFFESIHGLENLLS